MQKESEGGYSQKKKHSRSLNINQTCEASGTKEKINCTFLVISAEGYFYSLKYIFERVTKKEREKGGGWGHEESKNASIRCLTP